MISGSQLAPVRPKGQVHDSARLRSKNQRLIPRQGVPNRHGAVVEAGGGDMTAVGAKSQMVGDVAPSGDTKLFQSSGNIVDDNVAFAFRVVVGGCNPLPIFTKRNLAWAGSAHSLEGADLSAGRCVPDDNFGGCKH